MRKDNVIFNQWSILGHERIIEGLKNAILKNEIPHAFIFSGPSGIGKKLVAYNFIKSILCQGSARPCLKCDSCLKIDQGTHPDIFSLGGAGTIKIEEIRKLKHKFSLTPFISPYKICLLEGAENLTQEAVNASLKILEEPKGKTIIILLTENYEYLLPTIISRCILLKFHPISSDEIKKYILFRKGNVEENLLEKIVLKSKGRVGVALDYLKSLDSFKEEEKIENDFIKIISKENNYFEKLDFLRTFPLKDIKNLEKTLDIWLSFFHELILLKLKIANIFRKEEWFKNFVKNISLIKIKENILEINRTKALLAKNINRKLLLENLLFNL